MYLADIIMDLTNSEFTHHLVGISCTVIVRRTFTPRRYPRTNEPTVKVM